MHLGLSAVYKDDRTVAICGAAYNNELYIREQASKGKLEEQQLTTVCKDTIPVSCLHFTPRRSVILESTPSRVLHLDRHLGEAKKVVSCCASASTTSPTVSFSPNNKSICGTQKHYSASNILNPPTICVDNVLQTLIDSFPTNILSI